MPLFVLSLAVLLFAGQGFFVGLRGAPGLSWLDWLLDPRLRREPFFPDGPEAEERIVPQPDLVHLYPDIVFRQGSPDRPWVALTFDDGPDDRFTPAVLDVLKRYNVLATFFLVGAQAERHPHVTRRIVEEGHEIGHHGYQHLDFSNLTDAAIRQQLTRTAAVFEELVNRRVRIFRPPYAAITPRVVETVADAGYKVVLWSIDSLDWRQLDAKTILANVIPELHPGAIILLHSAGGDLSGTVEALPLLIEGLLQEGLRPVTVSQLLGWTSPELNGR